MKPGLTALGTAAVLGIYAAGFALTDEAAHGLEGVTGEASRQAAQMEGLGESRRATERPDATSPEGRNLEARDGAGAGLSSVSPNPGSGDGDGFGSAPEGTTDAINRDSGPRVAAGQQLASAGASSQASASPTSATSESAGTSPAQRATPPADARSGSAGTVASSGAGSSSGSAATSSAAQSQGQPPASGSTTAAPAGSSTPAAPAPQPESPYLDGKYTAWGIRTGHGTIEATVEISGGRIAAAAVTTCNMRWPCTDVDPLIPRILRAQRPGVPVISGATQSSDAFMTAVDEALTLARAAKTAQSPSS